MKHLSKIALISILVLLSLGLAAQKTTARAKAKPKPLVTFVELGSVNCVPCKMMKPVMKEVEDTYGDKVEVVFYDVWQPKDKDMATKYKIKVIPTQVFLDKDGKEFSRHEGFYPAAEIKKLLDAHLKIKRK